VFEISKGDGLFDLVEVLLELFARSIGRMLGKTSPDHHISLWGWTDWLWLAVVILIVVALVRRHRRLKREAAANMPIESVGD
jgi:hypothetical protein